MPVYTSTLTIATVPLVELYHGSAAVRNLKKNASTVFDFIYATEVYSWGSSTLEGRYGSCWEVMSIPWCQGVIIPCQQHIAAYMCLCSFHMAPQIYLGNVHVSFPTAPATLSQSIRAFPQHSEQYDEVPLGSFHTAGKGTYMHGGFMWYSLHFGDEWMRSFLHTTSLVVWQCIYEGGGLCAAFPTIGWKVCVCSRCGKLSRGTTSKVIGCIWEGNCFHTLPPALWCRAGHLHGLSQHSGMEYVFEGGEEERKQRISHNAVTQHCSTWQLELGLHAGVTVVQQACIAVLRASGCTPHIAAMYV